MAILRPNILPTLGLPTQVVAPTRQKKNMAQPSFFQQQTQPAPQAPQLQDPASIYNSQIQPQQDQFQSDPASGDYIKAQLASYSQRQALPQLQPAARVKAPDQDLVNPANFQGFYDRLGQTQALGDTMLATASAKSAFKKQKELNDVLMQKVQTPNTPTLSTGGQAFGSGVPSNPAANFKYAQEIGPQFGWGANDLSAWYTLGMKESGWRNNAQNPTSTAYGIGQFLDSTWKGVGGSKTSDPRQQVQYMAQYIKNRYGSPSKALAFHLANNWY